MPETPFLWPETAAPAEKPSRKVLALCYHFPPSIAVAAHRTEALHRWLDRFGWKPVIITAEREGMPPDILQTPDHSRYRAVHGALSLASPTASRGAGGSKKLEPIKSRIKKALRHWRPWHDEYAQWSYSIIPEAIRVGREQGVDMVWATCNPFTLAPVAVEVAHALHVPCVIDLRDPLPEYLSYGAPARHWFYRALRQVDAVTLAVPTCASPRLFQVLQDPVLPVIISGAWLSEAVSGVPDRHFRLIHPGMMYQGERNPSLIFQGLARWLADNPGARDDVRICFAGAESAIITQAPEYAQFADLCEIYGALPYREVVPLMARSSMLLIIKGNSFGHADALPAKFFDYLSFGSPVVAIGGEKGVLGELLEWTNCGHWANTPDRLAELLQEQYTVWKQAGVVTVSKYPVALAYLTQQRMAAEFAEVFNSVVERRPLRTRNAPPWNEESA